MRHALLLATILAARTAHAEEPTAADVENAPMPGQESGRTDTPEGDSTIRNVGQAVLVVPRVAVQTALAPVRSGIYLYDRYRLSDRFSQAFFDRTETYGLYPTASFDSVYGVNVGARVVHRNLLGEHEKFALKGTTGGQFRTLVDGRIRSGTRFGKNVVLELRGEFERRPQEPFFGIGNDSQGIQTRYREELKRFTSYLDLKLAEGLVLRTTGAITSRVYAASTEDTSVEEVYDTMTLTGFDGGVENMYGELELRWDRRGREETPGRHRIYDTGYMLSAFGGRVHQLDEGNDYVRFGGEAQHFLGIGLGPRSLMTRLHVEAVTGGLDDVAFNQLPALGGQTLLRGYAPGRFRDRGAVVGSVEYFWGLGQMFLASLFVDGGRVYRSVEDIDADHFRMGFGASLQLHGARQYISGLTVASSIDGGLFVNLTFDPVFDHDPRAERR